MASLTFLLPGLKGPFPGLPKDAVPELPSLETLLAKSRQRSKRPGGYYRQLCDLFGLEQQPGRDLPVAALSRLVDDTVWPEGIWMRADPIHLRPGMNDLTLIDTEFIPLSQHDAILLGTPLRDVFAGYGWELEIPMARRWYIRIDQMLEAITTEICEVRGKDIQQMMPVGRDRPRLDRLMTEVQMLLYNNQLNLEREQQGLLTLNSLWFWGCGCLPETLSADWSCVISDDPVAQGLAAFSGIPYESQLEGVGKWLEEIPHGNILVVKDDLQVKTSYQDYSAWQEIMYDMEENWFEPALAAVQAGDLQRVTIITEGVEHSVTGLSLKKFWSRRRGVL